MPDFCQDYWFNKTKRRCCRPVWRKCDLLDYFGTVYRRNRQADRQTDRQTKGQTISW